MRIVIAPDKFKGTLTAAEVADIIASELHRIFHDEKPEILAYPMADGGEGTAHLLSSLSRDSKKVFVDSSRYAGSDVRNVADPMCRSSYGLGKEVVRILTDSPDFEAVVTIGGTLTVDAGLGFLQALGAEIFTPSGLLETEVSPQSAPVITAINLAAIPHHFSSRISGVADVDLPLFSTRSGVDSMLMFAPQKGVGESQLMELRQWLYSLTTQTRWEPFVPDFESRSAGAGGGIGFAISGALRRPVVSGASLLIELYGIFREPLPDLIITGEGCYDKQTSKGKVVGEILAEAARHGVKVYVIAGCIQPGCEAPNIFPTAPFGSHPTPAEAAENLRNAVRKLFA